MSIINDSADLVHIGVDHAKFELVDQCVEFAGPVITDNGHQRSVSGRATSSHFRWQFDHERPVQESSWKSLEFRMIDDRCQGIELVANGQLIGILSRHHFSSPEAYFRFRGWLLQQS